ncbi:MAG: amidohydrolase family protein [Betaproteobacteria bacterium]|jgi:imidazolonepropionase-like amidohydrolase|nr:amidohydrolase family protein [Pseudomonadota bacterium]NBO02962.1 amidohydrolase family protein [Betaproteobacteria bacterium]NBO13078.1 amidohydrolase family protein [Betaproteobacteria bacterium]NBO45140.1 amidohydrolase family protein [Betaproteobacteria bacterium]NBO94590.1 amidohydrolase family protein [Betaproteobacteria bacterium]
MGANSEVLFTNVRILDGSGEHLPYPGSVRVRGQRIVQVGRSVGGVSAGDALVVDAAGATLMPGMTEAHTHFSWNDAASLAGIQTMPLEEHVLWTAKVAKQYLEAGFTSCLGAACAKPRLDVVIRNAINSGQIPGPRYLAASQEITVPGGLGDEMLPHLPFPDFSFGVVVNGAEDLRRVTRTFLKYGVDTIKLNLSGDNFVPGADAKTTWMTDAEVAACAEEVRMRGKRIIVHARSCASVKQALRHGIRLIYHASFTDTEALDMLEDARDEVFVAPGIGILYAMLHEAEPWGVSHEKAVSMGYEEEWAAACESLKAMHRRGVRVLPGGDYGFAFNPHLQNARDLELFVKYLGFTPMEAIRSCTRFGGQVMMQGRELGLIKEGYLADLLLLDGDPLANLSILRDPKRILSVMKDGQFAKAPPVTRARAWEHAA